MQEKNVGMHKRGVTVQAFLLASLFASVCVLCMHASLPLCLCECVLVCVCYKAALTSSNPPRVHTVAVAF